MILVQLIWQHLQKKQKLNRNLFCYFPFQLFEVFHRRFRLVATTNESFFFFSFCNPIMQTPLSNCTGVASSCEYNVETNSSTSTNINLGKPETTRFELRTSPSFPMPQLALVVDNGNKTRTVAFLVCPQLIPFEIIFTADGASGETDSDGAELYVSWLILIFSTEILTLLNTGSGSGHCVGHLCCHVF